MSCIGLIRIGVARVGVVALLAGGVVVAGLAGRLVAEPEKAGLPKPPIGEKAFSPEQMMGALGQSLVTGLRGTEGCLGAEAGNFASGKLVIFGWFKDKAAAMRWHESAAHKQVSERFAGGRKMDRVPMEHVPDAGPLMVVASVVMQMKEGGPPDMKFGIEVYAPLPGGFSFKGGAFSPEGFQGIVEQMRLDAKK
jgi:hypothetical protein